MLRYSITSFILTHKNNCTLSICPVTITVLNLPAGSIEGKYVINGKFFFMWHLWPISTPYHSPPADPEAPRNHNGTESGVDTMTPDIDTKQPALLNGSVHADTLSSYIRTAIIIILISHIIVLSWAKYECFYFFLFFFACGNCSEIHLIATIHIEY